jgi:hypothetical protein
MNLGVAGARASEPASAFAHGPGFPVPRLEGVALGARLFPSERDPGPRKAVIYEGPPLPSPRSGGLVVATVVKVAALEHEPDFRAEVALQRRAGVLPGAHGQGWLCPAVLAESFSDRFAYLVMEAVGGMSFEDEHGEAAWAISDEPGSEHAAVAADVRSAVRALARAGIAFRDRTPRNFLWGTLGGAGEPHVVVVDFGHAREAEPDKAAEEAEGALWNEDFR